MSSSARLNEAEAQLHAADPVLAGIIDAHGPIPAEEDRRGSRRGSYEALARAITGQQLSTKAAATIWGRVSDLFGGSTPSPEAIIEADPQALRDAGLSWAKVSYLRDLAERVRDGDLDVAALPELPDEEVIAALTAIKGVGRWTAEMFLMFHLGRPDVISCGDLGIRKAVQIAYGHDELPSAPELEGIAEAWRPHRTLACMYLWRSLDNAPG